MRTKIKKYSEIKPSNRTDFPVLYHSSCRTLAKLKAQISRDNNKQLPPKEEKFILRLCKKLEQICANYKNLKDKFEEEKFRGRKDF